VYWSKAAVSPQNGKKPICSGSTFKQENKNATDVEMKTNA
jgi:hypothetical protein